LRADALMRSLEVSAGACEHRAITGALEAYAAVRRPHGRADGGGLVAGSLQMESHRLECNVEAEA